jgi:hypothetical protein
MGASWRRLMRAWTLLLCDKELLAYVFWNNWNLTPITRTPITRTLITRHDHAFATNI